MPAVALSRVDARVVESGPGGQDLAVCAFTAAGNDRFTAVGQWIRGLARTTWPGCAPRGMPPTIKKTTTDGLTRAARLRSPPGGAGGPAAGPGHSAGREPFQEPDDLVEPRYDPGNVFRDNFNIAPSPGLG